jgi:hypothetical protein
VKPGTVPGSRWGSVVVVVATVVLGVGRVVVVLTTVVDVVAAVVDGEINRRRALSGAAR